MSQQPEYIDRPPRIQPELPIDEIRIPAPPQKDKQGITQLLQSFLPMVTIFGFLFMGVSGGRGNILFVLPMAIAGIATTAFAVYGYLEEKRLQAEAERAYNERLIEMTKEMHGYHDEQRRFYSYSYPDTGTTVRLVDDARYELSKDERSLRTESRLWERRVDDEDFGVIRLGMGSLASTVVYTLEQVDTYEDPLARAALKLQEDSKFVHEIPVIISLRPPRESGGKNASEEKREETAQAKEEESRRTPSTSSLGIAGDREAVYRFARSTLAHFAVFHPPADARVFVLANSEREWNWVEDLPHTREDEKTTLTCFLDRKGKKGEDSNPLAGFSEMLRRTLSQRKLQMGEREENDGNGEDPTQPFLLVVVDLMDTAYNPKSPLYELESDPAFAILLAEGAILGASVIFLVPERSKIPSGCNAVIEVERTSPASNSKHGDFQRIHFRYAETGLNTFRYVGAADGISTRDEMHALTKKLAMLQMRESFGAKLVSVVPFMNMMGFDSLDALINATGQYWTGSMEPRFSDWLRAPVGLMSGRKLRTLTFSAKRDGVHGMVAGSTGSGKSELLISMITAMSVLYDPSTLNFVLVDYKGGGAFAEFKDLPHCVDIITNLAGEGVTRMFTAINAELRRRQKLNVDTQTKNIVDYRQKGLHVTHQPYPFLFIIIDEFAEMIADRAEYKTELETITRVGRAQGVSLILAAQRPSGVTDQMRSNIKFRICLRVETSGESREMLRRPEAAYLPGGIPGRGYLQVGNDDIELIQVAYSGDKYEDPSLGAREHVIWVDRGDIYNPDRDREPPELYKVIINTLNEISVKMGISEQGAPWPDFLPTRFGLATPLVSSSPDVKAITFERYLDQNDIPHILFGSEREPVLSLNPWLRRWMYDRSGWNENPDWENFAVRPIVGLVDNPYGAKQLPMVIELPRGHAAMFGTSGWGKSNFIRTLAVSLAATHSPSHLHMYLLDLGGRTLGILEELPHVGAVINPDDPSYKERVEQLIRQLNEIVETRKTLISGAGVGDSYQYNALHPDKAIPSIVVAVDNFTEFMETFGEGPDNVETTLDRFVSIARECKPFGIHIVLTASGPGVLNMKTMGLFSERFALKLGDPADNREVIGVSMPEISDIAGRGYLKHDRVGLSFQIALPLEPNRTSQGDSSNENEEISELAGRMHEQVDLMAQAGTPYNLPIGVGALPTAKLFKEIFARQHQMKTPTGDAKFVDAFREIVRQRWARSMEPEHAEWLRVTFALAPGDRLREMRLEAKRDGVHGLVAGGTGAGKSELLMTMIVGLALNYDPAVLNFVLVDYKGGGAFKPFEDLPHCVQIVTNLNKAAVRRMFTSINAEMQRRQKLNADTLTKDIVEYREKGFHLTREPYPHMFIIIDEYAEMISDSPEFKAELESITRVGRSAGVNLILAAQRPTGVTDQMRANIKFRICLRVEEVETSREMLRRSDAAFLPNGVPGRGYLQVGNEGVELIQVAYTGENHPYAGAQGEGSQTPKFYDVAVAICRELLQGEMPRTPWPPFLPKAVTFDEDPGEVYLDASYMPLMTLDNKVNIRAINPFVNEWLEGRGAWYGVDWNRHAMRAIAGMLDDPYGARRMPMVVDFSKGHVVIFGASGWGKTTFFRSLILSLAASHSPNEFQAHILDLGGRNLAILGELPQVGTIITPDAAGYEEQVQQLMRELNSVIEKRKKLFADTGASTLFEYNASNPDKIEPALLVAIDNFGEYIETFGGNNAKEGDPNNMMEVLVAIVRNGRAYGIHVMISALRLNALASKLYSLFTERLTLRLADADDYSGIVGQRIPEVEEISGRGSVRVERQALGFQIALPPGTIQNGQIRGEAQQIRAIGMQMNKVATAENGYRIPFRISAIPSAVMHKKIVQTEYGTRPERPVWAETLRVMHDTWERNQSAEHADWLRATLGEVSGNRNRTLRLEAKYDGVHGMIAGGTGSGKSEILMTLIVSLAMNYSPDILNFVLVDYKGGGAFKAFETLPHCVDIVTNLNKAAVNRMFTSINAEIRRRQKMNADTATKDIVEYRKKGLHLNGGEPYPHLFVIIDEYAEMIDDNEAYKAELESITRVGRAQGVNLLLASQRPKGVTDQMRANIKLRLCLRVEQTDTSMEMLRRPDAAFLPNGMPGRGYLQIGNDNFELIQISYTGEKQPDDRAEPVEWSERPEPLALTGDDVPRLYDAVVSLSQELVAGKKTRKPWPAFLPSMISLQSPIMTGDGLGTFFLQPEVTSWLNNEREELWQGVDWRSTAMRPVTGLLDDPVDARQVPLQFNMSREHLVVYGDSGWGKTSFLRTMITSLAATHSPNEFHCYVVDLSGRNYRAIEALPHIGAVIYATEERYEERLHRLMDRLSRLADERSQILADAGATNLYEYNETALEKGLPILPAVLTVLDNWGVLQETQDGLVESVITPLLNRCLASGISFVITANGPNNLYSRVQALFAQRITFRQSDSDRLMDIVGRGTVEMDEIAGRGYIRVNRRPMLYQAALPVGMFDTEDGRDTRPEAEELRLLAQNMEEWVSSGGFVQTAFPDPIDTLPDIVPLITLLDETPKVRKNRVELVPGRGSNLRPTMIDLKRMAPHFVVMGPPRSGKTTAMYTLLFSLLHRNAPAQAQVVIIDLNRKFARYNGQHTLADLPHVLKVIYEIEELEDLVEALKAEAPLLSGTDREIFVFIDSFDDAVEEIENKRQQASDLTMLVRRYGTEGMHFLISGGTSSGMSSELRRRIGNANFGIGLKTANAVEAFQVLRTPAIFRSGRELPTGRGFTVRLAQPTMIQTATPYEGMGITLETNDEEGDDEALVIAALDKWVDLLIARYPDQKAEWRASRETVAAAAGGAGGAGGAPVMSENSVRLMNLLQKALRYETNRLKEGGADPVLLALLAKQNGSLWSDDATAMKLLKTAWRNEQIALGMDPDSMLAYMDSESLLFMIEGWLDGLSEEQLAVPDVEASSSVSQFQTFDFTVTNESEGIVVPQTPPAPDAEGAENGTAVADHAANGNGTEGSGNGTATADHATNGSNGSNGSDSGEHTNGTNGTAHTNGTTEGETTPEAEPTEEPSS